MRARQAVGDTGTTWPAISIDFIVLIAWHTQHMMLHETGRRTSHAAQSMFQQSTAAANTLSLSIVYAEQCTYLSAPDANLSPRVSALRTIRTLDKMLCPAFCHLSIICCLWYSSSSLSLKTPARLILEQISECVCAVGVSEADACNHHDCF